MVKSILRRLHWIASAQLGLDIRKLVRSMLGLPRFVRDLLRFRAQHTGQLVLLPCLHDWHEEAGASRSEYFWQDLLVARKIFESNPEKHVDVGSRVDGFVAHVASFREIDVFDVRPITTVIPRVTFRQIDLMQPARDLIAYCDSLSCLHALEHFGLGRYGDPVNTDGFQLGLANLASLVRTNGVFYLSVPVGVERVEFNAHRISDPRTVVNLAKANALMLAALSAVYPDGTVVDIGMDESRHAELAQCRYALGIFTFIKQAETMDR